MLCYRCLEKLPSGTEKCPKCGQEFFPKDTYGKKDTIKSVESLSPGDFLWDIYEVRGFPISSGTGTIVKVRDINDNRIYMIKFFIFKEKDEDFIQRGRIICELLKNLEHPNICKVFEWGEEIDCFYEKMEYLEGMNLRRLIDVRVSSHGLFSLQETEPIIAPILNAIQFAHQFIPHGYLKPENIVLIPEGLKITDFGTIFLLPSENFVARQIEKGDVFYFLPPEIIKGGRIDKRTDVYSVGVLLYMLLTGIVPKGEFLPPSDVNKNLDEDVNKLILKSISEQPEKRFKSITEFKKEYFYLLDKQIEEIEDERDFVLYELLKELEKKPIKIPEEKEKPPLERGKIESELILEDKITSAIQIEVQKQPVAKEPISKKTYPEKIPVLEKGEKKAKKRFLPYLLSGISILIIISAGVSYYYFATLNTEGERKEEVVVSGKVTMPTHIEKVIKEELKNTEESEKPILAPEKKKEVYGKDEIIKTEEKKEPSKKIASSSKEKPQIKEKKEGGEKKAVTMEVQKKKEKCPKDMVLIPGGSFLMGSPIEDTMRNPGESINKKIDLNEFCIDIYEYPNKKGIKPMVNITLTEAENECRSEGKRLCTEEEWEKACKGPLNKKYPYGNDWDGNICNTETPKGDDRTIAPSGSFPNCKNEWGVFDMSGNVREWTSSRFATDSKDFVLKGGSYTKPDYSTRCAERYNDIPTIRNQENGFRCCKDIEK